MSLRTRLALFIAVAIAAALLVQGVFGYLSFRQQAYISLDRDLGLYLTQLQTSPRGRGPRGDSDDLQFLNQLFEGYVARARVVNGGLVVAQQADFPAEVPVEFTSQPETHGDWRIGSVALPSPQPGSLQPSSSPGSTAAYLQGAISSASLLEGLRRYRRTLFITVLSVSALGALVALLLSRPALRPLQHLLDTAQRVAASGDLSLRVPQEGGGELGELSATFNRMLERLTAFRVREMAFTRNASHELRTPLAAMKLHLSSYREGYENAEETLSVLDEEVERMTRLSEALLTLAREGRSERVGVDLAALARDVTTEADITYRGPERLELSGDPLLLRQALVNLLENARKHAPGADVTVRLEPQTDAGRNFAVLSVTDSGPGLSPDAFQRAGEAFYRAPGTKAAGSGLGLTVVAQVAKVHGGRLALHPNTPSGLRAELWLAVADESESHEESKKYRAPSRK